MDRKKWLCATVIISVSLVLLFAAAMIYGYSGLEEWLQNDGWSHRPLGEYVAHENFGVSVGVSSAIGIGLSAVLWGGSCALYRILDKKRK